MATITFPKAFLLLFAFAYTSCNGLVKTGAPNNQAAIEGPPKMIKNHFIPEFPEAFMFVQCGLQDKAGNMWFGTAGNGIYRFDGKSFVSFTHKSFTNFSLKGDLNHNDILCCTEDTNGNLWFGTRRGLIRYKPSIEKPSGKDFALFLIPENTIDNNTRSRLPYTFQTGDNFVWSILQDKSGMLWFGTSKGVYTHNPAIDTDQEGLLFRRFLDNDRLINNKHLQLEDISTMLQDKQGNIWLASAWAKGEGIVCYDGKSLVNFTPDNLHSFRSILERKNGDLLFLNAFNGPYLYHEQTFSPLKESMGIRNDTLVAMMEDRKGHLWLGHSSLNTKNGGDGGLWHYDGKELKLLTTKDGLSHNHVFLILGDRDGNLWFGTRNTGLCRFDGKTFTDYTE